MNESCSALCVHGARKGQSIYTWNHWIQMEVKAIVKGVRHHSGLISVVCHCFNLAAESVFDLRPLAALVSHPFSYSFSFR